jgi:hypothetical protein
MDKKLAEEKVREMLASLTPEQLAELQNSFAETMDTIKNESVEKLETLKVKLEGLQTEKKSLGAEYSNWDKKQELNQSIEIVGGSILNQENVIKVLENNGLIGNVTDENGYEYKDVPDFRKVDTTEFDFDEKNVLIIPTPKYVPFINEDVFKNKGYIFDAIRITEDSYMVSLGSYSRKEKEKNNFFIATLDQLVLIIDYYYSKAKAKNIENARLSNERSKERYFALSESSRRSYMFQRGIYRSLSASEKKKVSEAEFEAMDLEEREKHYLPIKTYGVKRLISKLGEGEMWVSFHNMYEDLIDKTKAIINEKGKLYANPTVTKYWRDFVEMINYKLNDIKIQREDYSDTYKQAIETSFGESNVDPILKEKYGILVKRQNGDKIKPVEIDLIEKSWIKIQSVYGNLKAEALKNNLKISHSGERLMFAMKALGVFIPQMGTIGVSNKLGEIDFRSTFSHETAHFIDNFIGKLNGKRWATDDYESLAGKIAFTFRNSMNKSKSDQTDYINATKECFARAFQQYFGMKTEGEDAITKNVDNKIAPEGIEIWKHPNFVNKFTFKDEVEPLIEQFLKENLDVFETTVDLDGTNDLAPVTEEEVEVETEKSMDFDFSSLFEPSESINDADNDLILSEEQKKEESYQKSSFDKKWASTRKEAIEKLLKQYFEAENSYKDWSSRQYKQNKSAVFLGGDDIYGQSKSIGAINEGRKQKALKRAESLMKESITDLKEIGLSVSEIDNLIKKDKPTEEPEESIEDLIEGLEILLESLEGEEKKDLEDTIEGLKLLL